MARGHQIMNGNAMIESKYWKKVLSRNEVFKIIITNNVPEFCDENLCSFLKCTGYIPYKTPPYHSKFNEIAERMAEKFISGEKNQADRVRHLIWPEWKREKESQTIRHQKVTSSFCRELLLRPSVRIRGPNCKGKKKT